ncbi:MAG: glycosyltransferase family 39 protein [Clostridiales bacterium]|nr:glycosyltransferase family 39 protein [Clostridiales bacterium]
MDGKHIGSLKLISEHPYIVSGLLCISVWLLTGGSTSVTGINSKTMMVIYITLMALLFIFMAVLAIIKKLDIKAAAIMCAAGGFLARTWYVIYAKTSDIYQHDVGTFDFDMNKAVHDNYILYLLNNHHLPDFDFRGTGQFYHPPLHHAISAAAIKVNSLIFPGRAGDYGFLQCISLFYSLVTLILIYKILKAFGFEKTALICSFALACFYPYLIVSAGHINNDPLANMLVIAAFYNAIKWYREHSFGRIIITAICIGLGMMTKISAGLIAFPVGFIFLAALIKARFRDKKMWLMFLTFAAVVFPLGLWFPVRNYIRWGIPPTYVFDLGIVPNQDLSGYSVADRLFGISPVTSSIPFVVFDINNKDYNIFMTLFKSSLFDEFDHHNSELFVLLAILLTIVALIVMVMIIAGAVKAFIKAVKEKNIELFAVFILMFTELTSCILFAFKYPLICSVNFRYVLPLIICSAVFTATCFDFKSRNEYLSLLTKFMTGAICLFCMASAAFYSCEFLAFM